MSWIASILGIPNFKKEIQDLKTTIDTLKKEATSTYKKYEEAFAIIKALDLQDKNKRWWEQDIKYDGKNHETMMLVHNIKRSEEREFAANNPSLKIRKIFHGGCLYCQTPLDKGIGVCTGCQYLMGWDYPDLSTKKTVSQENKS